VGVIRAVGEWLLSGPQWLDVVIYCVGVLLLMYALDEHGVP